MWPLVFYSFLMLNCLLTCFLMIINILTKWMKCCVLLIRETPITNLLHLSSDGLCGGLSWITTRDNVWRDIHVSFIRRGLWSAATGLTSHHFFVPIDIRDSNQDPVLQFPQVMLKLCCPSVKCCREMALTRIMPKNVPVLMISTIGTVSIQNDWKYQRTQLVLEDIRNLKYVQV